MLGLPDCVTACLFDLDGVLTDTAAVHALAWDDMFNSYLHALAARTGEVFDAFNPSDYHRYVDGKARADGVRDFLASRGIRLAEGAHDDPPNTETVHGLGNRKNEELQRAMQQNGVTVFEGSRRYLRAARDLGIRRVVVSSSANAEQVLQATGLDAYVERVVSGHTLAQVGLRGKPASDAFLEGARLVGAAPAVTAVFEDSVAGVAAGRAGAFGYVVGIDRVGRAAELKNSGADVVVKDLEEFLPPPATL